MVSKVCARRSKQGLLRSGEAKTLSSSYRQQGSPPQRLGSNNQLIITNSTNAVDVRLVLGFEPRANLRGASEKPLAPGSQLLMTNFIIMPTKLRGNITNEVSRGLSTTILGRRVSKARLRSRETRYLSSMQAASKATNASKRHLHFFPPRPQAATSS